MKATSPNRTPVVGLPSVVVEMPRIVYNRARDRGYVRWSAGWTGGTFRLEELAGIAAAD